MGRKTVQKCLGIGQKSLACRQGVNFTGKVFAELIRVAARAPGGIDKGFGEGAGMIGKAAGQVGEQSGLLE